MKIIISPAKKLTTQKISADKTSSVQFLNETKYLIEQLKDYKVNEIKQLMGLSDNLAKLNHERYQQFDLKSEKVNPAIYMFQGDVYKAVQADKFSENDLAFAQDNLRIISGLYGLLKPLDLVFPYRLEMGTKMKTKKGKNLYKFWGDKLSNALSVEMKDEEVLVNLASNEYSKSLQLERFKQPIITPIFKDYKNGKLKVISFFAKEARGAMVNFIIKNKIKDPKDLKAFSSLSYKFSKEDGGDILFVR